MTSVALVRHTSNGVKYTLLKEKDNQIKSFTSGFIPKWDMSVIKPEKQRFQVSSKQYKQYVIALNTKKGKEILNNLKNSKTNEIINEYLTIEKDKVRKRLGKGDYISHKHMLVELAKQMIAEPLEGNNMLPHQLISITREEIIQEFIKHNLITQ